MIEQPYPGRAVITDSISELTLTIPAKKNWIVIVFMCFWLCGWLFGAVAASVAVFKTGNAGANTFIFFWLVFWLLAGFFVMNVVSWFIFGKEIVTIGNGLLTIKKTGTMLAGKTKSYDLAHIANMYVREQTFYTQRYNNSRSIFNRGTINFEYGLKTVRFGDGLDEAEAKHIIEMLKAKKFIRHDNSQAS